MRGWIFVAAFLCAEALTFAVVCWKNPDLVHRRLQKIRPSQPFDQLFVSLYGLMALAFLIVAGLDAARYSWWPLGREWIKIGLILYGFGAAVAGWAAVANSNLTCAVETEGRAVATGGPYRIVRHPMYVGRIISFLAWPLVLGSAWSYLPACAIVVLFIFRTVHEDKFLQAQLAGYADYSRRTQYRLLPGVW